MNYVRKIVPLMIVCLLMATSQLFAQKKGGHHHRHPRANRHAKVVVRRSLYRPAKVVVYHPYWGPKRSIHRRWVYFPKYNLYWDNWRNHYYFYNGSVWISQATPPPVIVNINIDNEKHYELKEEEDELDEVNEHNSSHQSEYKSE